MIDDVDTLVTSAVREVFDTMLNLRLETVEFNENALSGGTHIASAVGFIGRLTGVVYIYSDEAFAKHITGALLGLSQSEIESDEMVNDAMGEISNMVVGQIKSRLSDRGLPCTLTIPSIVRGSNFTIEAISSTVRRVSCFRSADQKQLLVETLIKPN